LFNDSLLDSVFLLGGEGDLLFKLLNFVLDYTFVVDEWSFGLLLDGRFYSLFPLFNQDNLWLLAYKDLFVHG